MLRKTQKVPTGHPEQCEGIKPSGNRCQNKKLEDCDYCSACGGAVQAKNKEKNRIYSINLAKYRDRVNHLSDHSEIKSLREEIGILRMVLEERLNSIKSPVELVSHMHTISDTILKIEKLVTSCHKLEKSMGQHLDKTAIMQFGQEIVQIITTHVDDTKAIDNIINDLTKLTERIFNETEEEAD